MKTSNNRRIEETATTALKQVLLRCPKIEARIDSNDRTPSWDGFVFVYKNEAQKKCDMIGRAPLQIKGTEKAFLGEHASYSCLVSDLNNYYRDGGCIFFLISVDTSTSRTNIYYSALQVFDLKLLLDSAGQQKSKTIGLRKFPQNNHIEITTLFLNFIENQRKQAGFIGKELLTIEELKKKGVAIDSVSWTASGAVAYNKNSIEQFISKTDFYLYAKPKGLDIEIPVGKATNPTVAKTVAGTVSVNGLEYYQSYRVFYDAGKQSLRIGEGINLYINPTIQQGKLSFTLTGTLTDYIKDTSFFVHLMEYQELSINGSVLRFDGVKQEKINHYKNLLEYYKDTKKMLDSLGVSEELQCSQISKNDNKNIKNFIRAVNYREGIKFSRAKDTVIYGPFKIANLLIWIWGEKRDDGYYQIESFFTKKTIVIFDNEDTEKRNPIPASHFLLLNKNAFVQTSNMDYQFVGDEICEMISHPLITELTISLLLNILRGYDERQEKDNRLLDLAKRICDWLISNANANNSIILRLNQLQIEKRRRSLSLQEKIELGKYTDNSYSLMIRCGALLLLDEINEAQQCFNLLSQSDQDEFISFPINIFGNLRKADEQ